MTQEDVFYSESHLWFPCFHQVCIQNPVVFVCPEQPHPHGHGPVGAGGLGRVWHMALDLSPPSSIPALWNVSSWDTFPDTFPVLFSGTSFSICTHWCLQDPLAQRVLLSVKWAPSRTPPLLSCLCCRSTLCQDVWSPSPGSSWQCHDRSCSFHLQIFTELAASIYCSLRSCFCMFNRSVTGNRVMGSLISLVPSYVLSPVKRRAGISFAVCPAGSALISQDLWVFLPQISPWGKRGWDLPRHRRSPLAQITAALPGTARKLLGKLPQLNCNLRGFSEYLNVLLLQFGENLIFHI